jgi:hypothetical protein
MTMSATGSSGSWGRSVVRGACGLIAGLAAIAGSIACGTADTPDDNAAVAKLHLTIALAAVGDVVSTRFEITPVDCMTGSATGPATVIVRALEDGTIPGGIGTLENNPLDEDSAHRFADLFTTVEAGCYDVAATPLNAASEPSAVCAAASKKAVVVLPGKTTEVFLLNQCDGEDSGNVDILAALNTAPHLQSIHFEKSKFASCHESQVVCATATDPENDPLDFKWTVAPEVADSVTGPTIISTSVDSTTGATTQCVSFVPAKEGKFPINVTVFDEISRGGMLVHIEDFLASEGYPHPSRASSDFFFYATCACATTTDVVMLHDLSGSFGDDLFQVRANAPGLFDALIAAAPDARLGVASFVDKPISPMGAPGDYVFQIEGGGELTADKTTFTTAVNGMMLRFGNDGPEAQIEGLMHVGTHAGALGYRPEARKFVVMMTDAPFHPEHDCRTLTGGASCPNDNDGDANIEDDEDYPAINQVANALIAADITPIFAVTADVVSTYQNLTDQLTALGVRPGKVVVLASDSSNIVDALLSGLDCR